MKNKFLIILLLGITILTGCQLSNNPTSKTEAFLSDYQMLEDNIPINYTNLIKDTNLTADEKEEYENLIKKQYRNLSYEIKEETIDGNNATVIVEIKVMDYKEIFNKYNKANYISEEYHKLIIEDLQKNTELVTYTIDFKIKKDTNKNWNVQELDEDDRLKLLGMK